MMHTSNYTVHMVERASLAERAIPAVKQESSRVSQGQPLLYASACRYLRYTGACRPNQPSHLMRGWNHGWKYAYDSYVAQRYSSPYTLKQDQSVLAHCSQRALSKCVMTPLSKVHSERSINMLPGSVYLKKRDGGSRHSCKGI